ncbi:QueG-associated DUF1730 domain-containing protein [Escherichia coli]|uniref:QueG-associated DUF1730 domain-containing protein n=1 Tax=Escherichia coli TaxID=562 RepID=UPI001CC7EF89|nr:QueG-associated DUF1730 domain-containing protein [Escherichia coli]
MSEPLDLNQLAQNIKQWGLELGFQQVGITDTDLSASEPKLQAWLDKQYHGEMDWMARHGMLRARPHELLPGTLRVISVRMNYLPANAAFASTLKNPKLGYVSRYALGRDYHKLLRNRLNFSPRKPLHAPELIELFAWSEEQFLKVTEGSAIRRIGHLRWLRNIAVALGNAPWDETILTALESRKGEHPLLDEHIAWAIAQQIERRNACVVEVQLPKKQRLVRVIEKGLPRDA